MRKPEGSAEDGLVPEDTSCRWSSPRAAHPHRRLLAAPTKFTAELRRRIVRVMAPSAKPSRSAYRASCAYPSSWPSPTPASSLGRPRKAQLPPDAIAVALEVQPIERQMLLGVEPALILQALECLLGRHRRRGPLRAQAERDRLGAHEAPAGVHDRPVHARLARPRRHSTDARGSRPGGRCGSRSADRRTDLRNRARRRNRRPALDDLPARSRGRRSSLSPRRSSAADPSPRMPIPTRAARCITGSPAHTCCCAPRSARARMPVERMLALDPRRPAGLEDRAESGVQLFAEGVPLAARGRDCGGAPRDQADCRMAPGSRPRDRRAGKACITPKTGGRRRSPHPGQPRPHAGRLRACAGPSSGAPRFRWPRPRAATRQRGRLDQAAEDPIELFVNGMCFAHGTPRGHLRGRLGRAGRHARSEFRARSPERRTPARASPHLDVSLRHVPQAHRAGAPLKASGRRR